MFLEIDFVHGVHIFTTATANRFQGAAVLQNLSGMYAWGNTYKLSSGSVGRELAMGP